MKWILPIFAVGFLLTSACKKADQAPDLSPQKTLNMTPPFVSMSQDSLYDKVLGMLVGSAIGDAMGAPTEMWSRYDIQVNYGFVDSLDDMVREPSPEGTWAFNLPAGGTTDDTRWKKLLGEYLVQEGSKLYRSQAADPYRFGRFIIDRYSSEIAQLRSTESFDPLPFEEKARQMAWLQEWAIVAKPFVEKDVEAYAYALNHFYGGEMTCAGMLYSPMIGLAYPGATEKAYASAFRLGIFDLGYARDITALTAAMVSAAMDPQANKASVLAVMRNTDPQKYFHSRLVGRSAYRIFKDTKYMVHEAKKIDKKKFDLKQLRLPFTGKDTTYIAQMEEMFKRLDDKNQDMPFHAGEVHMINLAAIQFADFDFRKSLEFVINYGRDNDTVAAITGAILGAFHGFEALPTDLKQTVLKTNKEMLDIDLETLAQELTEMMIETGIVSISV